MLPVGGGIYSWLAIEALVDLFTVISAPEGVNLWKPYMMGPVRRIVLGSFIYLNAVFWSAIPGVNILTSYIFGYWAVKDYYDYEGGAGSCPTTSVVDNWDKDRYLGTWYELARNSNG